MKVKKKRPLWVKIVCIALAALLAVVAVLGATFVGVWFNEIYTVSNFKQIRTRNDANDEGSVYEMKVRGGYYFDEFLEKGGASNDTQLINYISEKITRGLIDMSIPETEIGCSSFTATTPSGDVLFARNYDFDKTNVCVTLTNPGNGRYSSFSTVDLNYVGMDTEKDVSGLMNKITCLAAPYAPLDGMNEKGVSCGIYMSYQGDVRNDGDATPTVATNQQNPDKKNITSTTMLRLVLDYADSTDKAIQLIQNYNLHDSAHTSFHYMIADASGKSAILEWVNGTNAEDTDGSTRVLNVTYNTDARYDDAARDYYEYRDGAAFKYQWITNFIVKDDYYPAVGDDNMRGYDRYVEIYKSLKATDGVVADEQAAMDILAKVGRRSWTDSVSQSKGVTVHSVVYNLTKKTVLWVANENYNNAKAYYRYSF